MSRTSNAGSVRPRRQGQGGDQPVTLASPVGTEPRARLQGRTALVTGAARGIGLAIAERFVAEGASVVLLDLPDSGVDAAAAALGTGAERVLGMRGDVTADAELEWAIERSVAQFGSLDVLVNNAGIAPMRPFLDVDAALYDRVMAVNVRGSFFAALAAARQMVRQGQGGCILQIASTCAFSAGASRNLCVYNMSKAAVRQMVASLAGELAPHRIRVNGVAPGNIDTEMTRACFPDTEALAATARRIPLQQLGLPADIAVACAFLGSDEARYITGHTLVVDGGWLVR